MLLQRNKKINAITGKSILISMFSMLLDGSPLNSTYCRNVHWIGISLIFTRNFSLSINGSPVHSMFLEGSPYIIQ